MKILSDIVKEVCDNKNAVGIRFTGERDSQNRRLYETDSATKVYDSQYAELPRHLRTSTGKWTILDMQTANMLSIVYKNLRSDTQVKFDTFPIHQSVKIGWESVKWVTPCY